MSEKWVDACARMDAFVSAKEFLLEDPAAEKKFGFSLAAAWEAAQQSLLLSGVHVFLTPGQQRLLLWPPQNIRGLLKNTKRK